MQRDRLSLEAGSDDVFADSSAAVGGTYSPNFASAALFSETQNAGTSETFEGIQALSSSMSASYAHRRRILPNPPEGTIRKREYKYGPWMERSNRWIESENAKAAAVLFDKRVFDMAKQAVASLQVVGVRCEMTSIANTLRTACKYRDMANKKRCTSSEKEKAEAEHACRVLDACLCFDSRRLAALLGFVINNEKTFGAGVPV